MTKYYPIAIINTMSDNKIFRLALLTSFLIHSIFILVLPKIPFFPGKMVLENVQITYYKLTEKPKKKETIARKTQESAATKLPEVKREEMLSPPKPAPKKIERSTPVPERALAVKEVKEKKFETVVEEEQDDAKKATYINYYRAVREKIRQCADKNCSGDRKLGEGEIFLSFIVASSGELLQVRVVDEKSANDTVLRDIAINSIRDASPFPPFPQGMSQYQITFNVVISFESQ